jgi:hypothetical protein
MTSKVIRCPHCGLSFTPTRANQRFCCRQHRIDHYNAKLRRAMEMYRESNERTGRVPQS